MSLDKQSVSYRQCPDCQEPVPYKVRICPNCKAYQDWRRYVGMSQTNLALLVALVSVSTTLLNVSLPLLRSASSDIQVLFEGMSDTDATFIVRNEGRSGGVLHVDEFVIEVLRGEESEYGSSITSTFHQTAISSLPAKSNAFQSTKGPAEI